MPDNLLLLVAAVAPAVILLFYIFKKDMVEKEPIGLLIVLALCGAVPVAFCAYNFNTAFYNHLLNNYDENVTYLTIKRQSFEDYAIH